MGSKCMRGCKIERVGPGRRGGHGLKLREGSQNRRVKPQSCRWGRKIEGSDLAAGTAMGSKCMRSRKIEGSGLRALHLCNRTEAAP